MAKVDTLPEYLKPNMRGTSVRAPYCVVCGRTSPLNQHHVIRRGAGKLYRNGVEVKKPTLTLCGSGNTSGCHGLAHSQRLHFRWVETRPKAYGSYGFLTSGGHWEYVLTEPMRELDAQQLQDGWKPIRTDAEDF